MTDTFDVAVWNAGWDAASLEHRKGMPPSRNCIGNELDFRNGMTAYRDDQNLSDEDFDVPHNFRSQKTPVRALRRAVEKQTNRNKMPKKQKADARISEIKARYLERIEELWELHEEEFMQVLEESESRKLAITNRAVLNFAESTAKLETSISFSQVVKDQKQDDFDDPNQPRLPGVEDGMEPKNAKKAKKPKKNSTSDDIGGKAAASGERAED